MAAIQNARDVLLQAAATRLETVAGPTNVTTDFANVTGSTRPSNNADVTQTAVNSGVTASSGGITLSSGGAIKGGQTAYDSGNGFFLGYTGGAYKFSVGNSSGNKFTWDGSTLGIVGDISGTSNIDITGNARFKGAYTGAVTNAAVYANESNTAATGVFGTSSATLASHAAAGVGVWGVGTGAEAIGVIGFSNGSSQESFMQFRQCRFNLWHHDRNCDVLQLLRISCLVGRFRTSLGFCRIVLPEILFVSRE